MYYMVVVQIHSFELIIIHIYNRDKLIETMININILVLTGSGCYLLMPRTIHEIYMDILSKINSIL